MIKKIIYLAGVIALIFVGVFFYKKYRKKISDSTTVAGLVGLNGASPEVAKTIIDQLGGVGLLKMMLGVKKFYYDQYSVSFKAEFPYIKRNWCKIFLNGMDYYDVEFFKMHSGNKINLLTYTDVDAENLVDTVEQGLGLSLRKPKIRFQDGTEL